MHLFISNNRLSALPESIGSLKCLEVLNVSGNQVGKGGCIDYLFFAFLTIIIIS